MYYSVYFCELRHLEITNSNRENSKQFVSFKFEENQLNSENHITLVIAIVSNEEINTAVSAIPFSSHIQIMLKIHSAYLILKTLAKYQTTKPYQTTLKTLFFFTFYKLSSIKSKNFL